MNRHRYTPDEVDRELTRPVVRAQLAACRLRREHPAFGGQFTSRLNGACAELRWSNGENHVALVLDVRDATFELTATDRTGTDVILTDRSV